MLYANVEVSLINILFIYKKNIKQKFNIKKTCTSRSTLNLSKPTYCNVKPHLKIIKKTAFN